MKKLKRLWRTGTLGTNTHHEARNGQCGPAAVGNGLAFPSVIGQTSGCEPLANGLTTYSKDPMLSSQSVHRQKEDLIRAETQ